MKNNNEGSNCSQEWSKYTYSTFVNVRNCHKRIGEVEGIALKRLYKTSDKMNKENPVTKKNGVHLPNIPSLMLWSVTREQDTVERIDTKIFRPSDEERTIETQIAVRNYFSYLR